MAGRAAYSASWPDAELRPSDIVLAGKAMTRKEIYAAILEFRESVVPELDPKALDE